jgi:hypothetical protein
MRLIVDVSSGAGIEVLTPRRFAGYEPVCYRAGPSNEALNLSRPLRGRAG